ncbi:MAG: hypothetical protein ACKVP0_11590 [Pirellulaceae bacterium]
MEQPAKDDMQAKEDSVHWSRHAARLSAASAFVCFTLNCIVNQLMLKDPQPERAWVWLMANILSGLIIGVGIVSGLLGVYGGIRKKSGDTIGIALLGLLLHGGILFAALWLRAALKAQAG